MNVLWYFKPSSKIKVLRSKQKKTDKSYENKTFFFIQIGYQSLHPKDLVRVRWKDCYVQRAFVLKLNNPNKRKKIHQGPGESIWEIELVLNRFSCLVHDLSVEKNNGIVYFFFQVILIVCFGKSFRALGNYKLILICWREKSAKSPVYACASAHLMTLRPHGLTFESCACDLMRTRAVQTPSQRRLRILSLTTWMMLFRILPFHLRHRDSPDFLVSDTVSPSPGIMGWKCPPSP